jgi:hypothetical protein
MAMAAKLQDHPVQSAPGKGADANFKNPTTALSSSDARQNLKFEREDWTSFRTLEGLQQKADACLVARCASAECPQNRFAVRSRLRPPCPTPNSAEHRVSVQSHPTACAPFHAFRKPRRVIGAGASGLHTAIRWRRSQSPFPQTKTPAPRKRPRGSRKGCLSTMKNTLRIPAAQAALNRSNTAHAVAASGGVSHRELPERQADFLHGHDRDAPVRCPVCDKRVQRRARQQTYCSRKCRQRAHYDKSVAEGRFDPLLGKDTRLPTNLPQKSCNFSELQATKTGSEPPNLWPGPGDRARGVRPIPMARDRQP